MIRLLAIVLLITVGLGALFGGTALVLDTSGKSLNISAEILKNSPFDNFLLPGLILLIVLGFGSIVTSITVIKRANGYPFLTIFMGFALSIWIAVQMLIIHEVHLLHLVFGILGILLIVLGMVLRKREYGSSR